MQLETFAGNSISSFIQMITQTVNMHVNLLDKVLVQSASLELFFQVSSPTDVRTECTDVRWAAV